MDRNREGRLKREPSWKSTKCDYDLSLYK